MARNVIIVGGGRVGRHAAEQLSEDRNNVTIVELDHDKCEQVSPKVHNVVQGDGTMPEVLDEANLVDADVVAALTNDTEVNLTVCELAHEENDDIRTILRIATDGERDHGHRHFVDDITYPAAAGAKLAAEQISSE